MPEFTDAFSIIIGCYRNVFLMQFIIKQMLRPLKYGESWTVGKIHTEPLKLYANSD